MEITRSFGGNNDNNNDGADELAALSLPALRVEPHVEAGFLCHEDERVSSGVRGCLDSGSTNT